MIPLGKAAWRPGAHLKVAPDVALAELLRIDCDGLTPNDVKEAARPEDSPLHADVFPVGPAEAAERFYTERAGYLIAALVVYPEGQEDFEPVFVHIQNGSGHFEQLRVVLSQPDRWELALVEAKRDLAGARASLRRLENAAQDAHKPVTRVRMAGKALDRAIKILVPG